MDSRACSPLPLSLWVPEVLERSFPGKSPGLRGWLLGTTCKQTFGEQQQWQRLPKPPKQRGRRKGQDNGPFVSMETALQGEGLKEEKASTSPPSGLGKFTPTSWSGSPFPLPSLPGVHHGNPSSKQEVQSLVTSGVGRGREPRGNGTSHPSLMGHRLWPVLNPGPSTLIKLGTTTFTSLSSHLPSPRLL